MLKYVGINVKYINYLLHVIDLIVSPTPNSCIEFLNPSTSDVIILADRVFKEAIKVKSGQI